MSLPNELLPVGLLATPAAGGAPGEPITIERSLRFNPADSAYLNRTPASAGNRKKWTWAGWVKRSKIGVSTGDTQYLFDATTTGTNEHYIRFSNTTNYLQVGGDTTTYYNVGTAQVFRDPSAWYHIVVAMDTTQATDSDRIKIYVNGVRVTEFSTTTWPVLNNEGGINSTNQHNIGRYIGGASRFFDGYLAEVHFIDGQALDPTSFGEFDATTDIWGPIEYTGSYGTNGFHLPFSDNSSVSALGTDTSGNGNDWTVNNISVGDGTIYSTGFTASGGTFYGSSTAQDAFNGLASPYAVSLDTSTFQFAPTTSIPINTSLRVWYPPHGGFESTKTVTIDGVSSVLNPVPNSYYFHDCSALVGKTISTSTPLTITATGSRTQVSVTGIEVDGVLLTDAPLGDSLRDSPTNGDTANDTGLGGEVPGNYCTWNPLTKGSYLTLQNGNLDASVGGTGSSVLGTIGINGGKWYFEAAHTSDCIFGVANSSVNTSSNPGAGLGNSWTWYSTGSALMYFVTNGSFSGWTVQKSLSDTLQIAVDATDIANIKVYAGINDTWYNSSGGTTSAPDSGGSPMATITGGVTVFPIGGVPNATSITIGNFGQRAFAYSAPSGFKALCTANLPTPTIEDGSDYMDVALYTGNGTSQTISGLEFSPDFVWFKRRDSTQWNELFDQVRTAGNALSSNSTTDEYSSTALTSFTSGGFSVGSALESNALNGTYAAWTWDGGSSTVSNTNGSITSSVRANASAGFSIVSFNSGSTNGNKTIGHGLGVAPSLIILKSRTSVESWSVYHSGVCDTVNKWLLLNATDSLFDLGAIWGAALPTSTVFGIQTGYTTATNNDMIAYCFAPVEGYSAFGSADGGSQSFVYTGFRPRYLMLKRTNSTSNWHIFDTARSTYNASTLQLYANEAFNEDDQPLDAIDFVSNGFVMRSSNSFTGPTWVYCAFAENPFKIARAR